MKKLMTLALIGAGLLLQGCAQEAKHAEGDGHDHSKDKAEHKEGDGHDHSKDKAEHKEGDGHDHSKHDHEKDAKK